MTAEQRGNPTSAPAPEGAGEPARDRLYAQVLRDTATAVAQDASLEEVLDHLLDNIKRVVPHDAALVYLLDEQHALLRAVRAHGYENFGLPAHYFDGFVVHLDQIAILRRMVETQRGYLVGDARTEADWVLVQHFEWVLSSLSVPIISRGVLLGCIALDSATPHRFSADDLLRLEAFANQAAVAIENARLVDRLQVELAQQRAMETSLSAQLRQTRLLNRMIVHCATLRWAEALQHVCADLAEFFNVPQTGVALIEADWGHLKVIAQYSPAHVPSAIGAVIPIAGNPATGR